MKKKYATIILALVSLSAMADNYKYAAALKDSAQTTLQNRIEAEADFKFNYLTLSIGEEIRSNLYPNAQFSQSNTTVGLTVPIVKGEIFGLSGHAHYMLRVKGNQLAKDTINIQKVLRHRVYFGLTQSFKMGMYKNWQLSLKERAVVDMRFDEFNEYQHQRYTWEMRYRLQLQYKALSQPLTPYVWTELIHSCNLTDAQKYYTNNKQIITDVRCALGLKWKINQDNSLNFYLRYDWTRDIDVDLNAKGTKIKSAYDIKQNTAIIGIAYNFGYKK